MAGRHAAPIEAPAPDASVAIEPVEDAATLTAWSRVLCDSFGAPPPFGEAFVDLASAIGLGSRSPFRHFLARVNGQPAATCSLFLGAGVAGIYDVSTMPEHRRRGIGASITRAAMQEARPSLRHEILHSSALGSGMYRGSASGTWVKPQSPALVGAGELPRDAAGPAQHRHLRVDSCFAADRTGDVGCSTPLRGGRNLVICAARVTICGNDADANASSRCGYGRRRMLRTAPVISGSSRSRRRRFPTRTPAS